MYKKMFEDAIQMYKTVDNCHNDEDDCWSKIISILFHVPP